MTVNLVYIIGRLGKHPKIKSFKDGSSITTLSVATSEKWTDRNTGEKREHTEWHNVILSGNMGLYAFQHLDKGSLVYIEGSLHRREYTDISGIQRYATEIKANWLQPLN